MTDKDQRIASLEAALASAITALNTAPMFKIPSLGLNSYQLLPTLENALKTKGKPSC